MNLSVAQCIENAKGREWEPHKYPSKQAQDANLHMLLEWIADYPYRSGFFSQQAHLKLYERFQGDKKMYLHNPSAS